MRGQFGLGEGPRRVLDGALVVGEGEVHEAFPRRFDALLRRIPSPTGEGIEPRTFSERSKRGYTTAMTLPFPPAAFPLRPPAPPALQPLGAPSGRRDDPDARRPDLAADRP